uniref:Carboxypeptidase n=1 Tax=Aegilops tauschii TaxID=37682 RepID=M8CAV7_AEGTA
MTLAYTGPGCSSLGYGAMQELGPFRVTEDNKTLSRNANAWNNVANVIFLESPAGVGYSYSNTSSDYDLSGDERTADDAYVFLVKWLERFPEYKDRAFYISGESYAGHYVPELAATILLHNTYNNRTVINLQGILVGNPYLDANRNIKGVVDYFWTHAVMSDEVYANITKNCDFDNLNGTFTDSACSGAAVAFDAGYIDVYNIYAPVCIDAPNGTRYPSGYLPGYDPCVYYPTYAYLNDPAVQMAFHARPTKWTGCANLNWTDAPMSMLPTMTWLIESKLPIWIFSGDFDSVCPLPATRYSIQDMTLSVTTPWRPWIAKEEVGGYVQQYAGGFTFLSVRGAGHMVPSFQPERALVMLSSFLQGVLPPYVEQQ